MNYTTKSGIYKITNLVNGKFYIGSSVNVKRRRQQHFRELRNNVHGNGRLQNSFNKYGEDNFSFEVIEYVNKETLVKREQYWIDKLDAANRNEGFNISSLANGPSLKGELNGMYGKTHTNETKEKLREMFSGSNNEKSKTVLQFNSEGKLLNRFGSLNEASAALGITKSGVLGCCNGRYRHSGGFVWMYEEDYSDEHLNKCLEKFSEKPKPVRNKRSIPVVQLDIDFNLVKKYHSLYQASAETGFDLSSICSSCKGDTKTVRGFVFIYESDYNKNNYKRETKKKLTNKSVVMLSLNGDFIKSFDSLKLASVEVSASSGSISKCCSGKVNTYKGYKWMYLEEYEKLKSAN